MNTRLVIHWTDLDAVRAMLARREKLNRIRELLAVEEVEAGSTLTDLIDEINVDALTVQAVLAPAMDAKVEAYRNSLPELPAMAVVAS